MINQTNLKKILSALLSIAALGSQAIASNTRTPFVGGGLVVGGLTASYAEAGTDYYANPCSPLSSNGFVFPSYSPCTPPEFRTFLEEDQGFALFYSSLLDIRAQWCIDETGYETLYDEYIVWLDDEFHEQGVLYYRDYTSALSDAERLYLIGFYTLAEYQAALQAATDIYNDLVQALSLQLVADKATALTNLNADLAATSTLYSGQIDALVAGFAPYMEDLCHL